jgi:hypothetical protein
MEWTIPLQKLELGYINIGHKWTQKHRRGDYIQKPMAPLSYFGPQFRLPSLSILFPPLSVVDYNQSTGKLILDMGESNLASIKLLALHETLINSILYHQPSWFKTSFTKEEIAAGFIPIFKDNKLILHCPLITTNKGIPCYTNGIWSPNINKSDIKPGTRIRISVKIHGISFLYNSPTDLQWSGKCRLQHRITGIIKMS